MLENLKNFLKRMGKKDEELLPSSSDAAKERLHLVLMQDRANVSIDFLELMKEELLDVIKKYIDIDENTMDVRFTNQINEDGSNGVPALYANIPIIAIKNEHKVENNNTDTNKEKINEEQVIQSEEAEPVKSEENKNKNQIIEVAENNSEKNGDNLNKEKKAVKKKTVKGKNENKVADEQEKNNEAEVKNQANIKSVKKTAKK